MFDCDPSIFPSEISLVTCSLYLEVLFFVPACNEILVSRFNCANQSLERQLELCRLHLIRYFKWFKCAEILSNVYNVI